MAEYASRQHAVIDLSELDRGGVPRSTVALWARTGRLYRLYRGVYSFIPPSMLTDEGRWLAAVKACRPSWLSHGCAAQLAWVISRDEHLGLHVSRPRRSRRRVPGVKAHLPRTLLPTDTTTRLKIPTTTVTRAIWDMAPALSPDMMRKALAKARGRDLLDYQRLNDLLTQAPRHGGSGLIRELLTESVIPLSEMRSWLEDLLAEICAEYELPVPVPNAPVLGYTVDFLWPAARFIVEADGGDHMDREQRDSDNERDAVLQRAGFLVRRYSSRAMGRRAATAREIMEIARERHGLMH